MRVLLLASTVCEFLEREYCIVQLKVRHDRRICDVYVFGTGSGAGVIASRCRASLLAYIAIFGYVILILFGSRCCLCVLLGINLCCEDWLVSHMRTCSVVAVYK